MLFDLWSKYEKRLPSQYLNEKIVETGEKLVKMEARPLFLSVSLLSNRYWSSLSVC